MWGEELGGESVDEGKDILGVLVEFLVALLALGGGDHDPGDLKVVDIALPKTILRACHGGDGT